MDERRAIIVVDLGYGDAGKGSVVDFLARSIPVHTVVRFNGGSQAAHNVMLSDGREHTFAQFGSGSFRPFVDTYLSRYMLVNPLNMLTEAEHLKEQGTWEPLALVSIDREAPIITPFQKSVNRIREFVRREDRHGSCGEGIGETMSDIQQYDDAVLAGDLAVPSVLRRKLKSIRGRKLDELRGLAFSRKSLPIQNDIRILMDKDVVDVLVDRYTSFAKKVRIVGEEHLAYLLAAPGNVVFEGAQGVLLDETFGFHPYTTWSTTTFSNALSLLEGYDGRIERLGLLRAYAIRHGPGPFVTEDEELTRLLPESHNETNTWQREVRLGYFDLLAARYALDAAGGVDYLGMTHLDRLATIPEWRAAVAYMNKEEVSTCIPKSATPTLAGQEELGQWLMGCEPQYATILRNRNEEEYVNYIQEQLGVPIKLRSRGPMEIDKSF